ncbi:hypothetical protein N7501_003285 [Penicillium viridicatum]|nr:hypothetical protein N7501_003285 [Penicillium viridicatum]
MISPFVYVARDDSPLTGCAHANKLGHLSLKTDHNIKNAPAFTLGPLMASASFVNMPRTIVRQYSKSEDDMKYARPPPAMPLVPATNSQSSSVTLQKAVQVA